MAGFGWNMHHDLNQNGKKPYATPQIACRICNLVFISTQALINHIETHMIEDGTAAGRQHEINLRLSQFQRDPHHPHILPNNSPYQYPNFTMSPAPIRPPPPNFHPCFANPQLNFQPCFVPPQALQNLNPFPFVPFHVPPAATGPGFLMPRPVPPTLMVSKFIHRVSELVPSCTNISQMQQPQYMATVDGNPQILAPKHLPINNPNVVMPLGGRDHQDLNNINNNNNKTSVDTELDLTLRL